MKTLNDKINKMLVVIRYSTSYCHCLFCHTHTPKNLFDTEKEPWLKPLCRMNAKAKQKILHIQMPTCISGFWRLSWRFGCCGNRSERSFLAESHLRKDIIRLQAVKEGCTYKSSLLCDWNLFGSTGTVTGLRVANLGDLYTESGQTLRGSFSAVSKPNFACNYSCEEGAPILSKKRTWGN